MGDDLLRQALRGAAGLAPPPAGDAAGAAAAAAAAHTAGGDRGAATAADATAPGLRPLGSALVLGAGGVLGAALLAEALVAGRFQRVQAVVAGPIASAVRGFQAVPAAALQAGRAQGLADTAFLVFERARHANGRDLAFLQPVPKALAALAAALRAGGVRRLLVVVPHAPALLPQALHAGFAGEAERQVAALGFEQLVFLRTAQAADGPVVARGVQRFAGWWLSQLGWMVPQQQQPVRAVRLAALAVELARRLPQAAPGTRVLPAEWIWSAAQAADPGAVLDAWLRGAARPAAAAARWRLGGGR